MARARALGFDLWGDLRQTDTYFDTPSGRMKLRETAGFPAELVFYERDEHNERRPSDYQLAAVPNGEGMKALLAAALGVRAVVRKRRTLLLLDTTRMHLDTFVTSTRCDSGETRELGSFLEFEVPVKDDHHSAAAERLVWLLDEFGLRWEECIRQSYADL